MQQKPAQYPPVIRKPRSAWLGDRARPELPRDPLRDRAQAARYLSRYQGAARLRLARPLAEGCVYVSVKLRSPSFSIDVTILSPGFSQTLSPLWPAMTPSGVPVKMMSPGLSVRYWEM